MSADEHGSKEKRDADLEHSMLLATAAILRNRLIVVESVAAAKLYMESSTKSGYKCRIAYTDFTQHHSLISKGVYSKVLCTQPTVKFQQEYGDKINALPMTSIIGTILSRAGGVTLESFHEKLSKAYGRPRSMFVPVSMPPAFLKHIKSASRRALGPHMDSHERSGIEFQMRMIGARADTSQNAPAEGLEVEDEDDDKTDDDDVQDVPEVADGTDATGPLDTMTKEGMNKAFRR